MPVKKCEFRTAYRLFGQGIKRAHINAFATSSAFYFFLSLVPLVLLFLCLLPYTPLRQETLTAFLLVYTPESFQVLINNIIQEVYSGSLKALSVSLLIVLWSAAKILSSLTQGIGEIYDGYRDENFFQLRMLGILYTVILIVFIVLDFSLFILGQHLIEIFENYLPSLAGVWNILLGFRSLIYIIYLTFYNALLFKTIPHKKLKYYRQLPGAAFSATAEFVFSKIFSWLIARFNIFSIYGSLSIIIISMFWLYYSMYILFLGAFLNTFPDILHGAAAAEAASEKADR